MATDIVLRNIKAAPLTHSEMDQNWESLAKTVDAIAADYTVLITDQNKILECNFVGTVTLPPVSNAASADTDSFRVTVKNINATGLVVTSPDFIEGANSITLLENEAVEITLSSDASEWKIINFYNANLLGVIAAAGEINALAGIVVTSVELNYTADVTGLIQNQLDNKQALDSGLNDISGLLKTDGNIIVGNGANWVAEAGNTARTSLGLGNTDNVTHNDLTVNKVVSQSVGLGISIPARSLDIQHVGDYGFRIGKGPTQAYDIGRNDASGFLTYAGIEGLFSGYRWITSLGTAFTINNDLSATFDSDVSFGKNVNVTDNLTVGNTTTDIRLIVTSQNRYHFASKNALGSTVYFGATAGANANAQISNNGGAAIATFKDDLDTDFAGSVKIPTNKHLYLGNSNTFDIWHDDLETRIHNTIGTISIRNIQASRTIDFQTANSNGVNKNGISIGGAIPVVQIYANGILEAESVVGAFNVVNQLQINGSTKIVDESKIDWPNFNGVAQLSFEKENAVAIIIVPTLTDYLLIRIPATATTLRYWPEMSCDTDNSRVTYMRLNSPTQTGTDAAHRGSTLRTFPANEVPSGTLDVSDQQGNAIRLEIMQYNNNISSGNHTGTVYNILVDFE